MMIPKALVAASASQPGTRVTAMPAAARARSPAVSIAGSASPVPLRPAIRPATSGPGESGTRNAGSSSRIPSSTAATSAPIGPTVSNDGASGYTPFTETRPCVVFRPTTPQQAAGTRTEPPVSVPSATSASPVATATADPLDDPAGGRHHRRVGMGALGHLRDDRAPRRRRQPGHVDAVLDRQPGAVLIAVRVPGDADHPGTHPPMITLLAENKINRPPCASL